MGRWCDAQFLFFVYDLNGLCEEMPQRQHLELVVTIVLCESLGSTLAKMSIPMVRVKSRFFLRSQCNS